MEPLFFFCNQIPWSSLDEVITLGLLVNSFLTLDLSYSFSTSITVVCVGRLAFTSVSSKPDAKSKVQGGYKQPHTFVAYLCVNNKGNIKMA